MYEVWSPFGDGPARLAGRLRHELAEAALPGAGDWVGIDAQPTRDRVAVIERVLPRRTVFIRGAAGRQTRAQVIAANVDVVLVVCGLDADYNPRRIERYLAAVWASGAEPQVVLSKLDLCGESAARLSEVAAHSPGVRVVAASALTGDGVDAIRAGIGPGTTAALVGSSGAGKSTLVNALVGDPRMAVGEVSSRDGRGQHTTTHRQLIRLPGGGVLLDTPGMRELQLSSDAGLDGAFEEVDRIGGGCHFSDCRHQDEPGCAVRAAVANGDLDADRFEHYLKLQRESRAFELRHDVHQRRQVERGFGRLKREVEQMRRKRWE